MASAGQLLSGKISTDEEILKVYSNFVGEDCARLLTSLNVATYFNGYNDFSACCESEYYVKYAYRKQLAYAVDELRKYESKAEGLAKDILTDIYGYVYCIYLELALQNVGARLYDGYETNSVPKAELIKQLQQIRAGYDEIEAKWQVLWQKYRDGIKSQRGKFSQRFSSKRELIDRLTVVIEQSSRVGVLYADLMMHDGFATVRAGVSAKYADGEESQVYKGAIKPSMAGFDCGGCYTFRYPIADKKVEWISFEVFGEGALYPTNFRYVLDGKQYIADRVETVCGWVKNTENMLTNDTRFAEMGYEDGIKHFNELSLSKEKSCVKIYFRDFVQEGK